MAARLSGVPQQLEIQAGGIGYTISSESHVLATGVVAQLRPDASTPRSIHLFPDGSSSGGVIDLQLAGRKTSVEVGLIAGHAELIE